MNEPKEVIWKITLSRATGVQRYRLPFVKGVLKLDVQNGEPVLWVRVWPETARRSYVVVCFATGDSVYGINNYLGTAQLEGGHHVLHYFSGGPGL